MNKNEPRTVLKRSGRNPVVVGLNLSFFSHSLYFEKGIRVELLWENKTSILQPGSRVCVM